MLHALKEFFWRGSDTAQLDLALSLPAPQSADELLTRLRSLGLARISRLKLTRNRHVMVSFSGSELRVNEGFLTASEPVFRAIVLFVEGRSGPERRAAQRVIVSHPIVRASAPSRREHTHPDDEGLAEQVRAWHDRYNAQHFVGQLREVDVRVSRRMKRRLGHYSAASPGAPRAEIAISRSHIKRHGWEEALHTLLHEMVHQWQDETGRPIDHGTQFRAKCREVGITPSARRAVSPVGRVTSAAAPPARISD